MTRQTLIRAALALVLSGAPNAGRAQQPAPGSRETRRPADSLTVVVESLAGNWDGTFRLDSAWSLPQRPAARAAAARVHFAEVGDGSPTTSGARSVHAGTFTIDFTQFGFALSSREALGWLVKGDSIRAVLNPTVDHGTVELRGVRRAGRLTGTWRYVASPGGAAGTFELRRASAP